MPHHQQLQWVALGGGDEIWAVRRCPPTLRHPASQQGRGEVEEPGRRSQGGRWRSDGQEGNFLAFEQRILEQSLERSIFNNWWAVDWRFWTMYQFSAELRGGGSFEDCFKLFCRKVSLTVLLFGIIYVSAWQGLMPKVLANKCVRTTFSL